MTGSTPGSLCFWSPRSWVPTVAFAVLVCQGAVAAALPDASCCGGGSGGCCGLSGDFAVPCTLHYGASGTVSDAETGEPIAGARVTVNHGLSTTSAADGSFSVSASRPDTCNIDYFVEVVVQAEGYETYPDGLYSSAPLRHVDVRLAAIRTPTPTPIRTPTPDPCAFPTAPQCPIGQEPECVSNEQCVGCRCKPCLPCPPGYHFADRTNVCECTHDFHRISGSVAEFPHCEGRMRGVTVRLEPLGETTVTSIGPDSGGIFDFANVPPGDYTLTIEPRCNPFGCWDPVPVRVVDQDVAVQVCPREGSSVRLSVGHAVGAPGAATVFDVRLDSGARLVASVSHTVSFDPEAPISATGEGAPDCSPNPDLDAGAIFTFEPPGCTPGADCERVRAEIESSEGALPDGSLYSCQAEIPDEPSDLCQNSLRCGDLSVADPAGTPLEGTCEDGSITSQLPVAELNVHFEVSPEHPVVGDPVELRVTVSGNGGLPQYFLTGADPILSGDTSPRSVSHFGTLVYDLQAVQNGAASFVMSVNYETQLGCPSNLYYGFVSDSSDPFVVLVGEGDPSSTPTPTPTATRPCPSRTPIQCHPAGITQQCEFTPGDDGSCPLATCRCVACPPCPEGEVFGGGINSCHCSADTSAPPGNDAEASGGGGGCAIGRRTARDRHDWFLVCGALLLLAVRRRLAHAGCQDRSMTGAALAVAVLLAALPVKAYTPTHTFGPSPTPTPTGTAPPPQAVITVMPNPARPGQRVVLDGSGSLGGFGFQWSQTDGDVNVEIENADEAIAAFVVPPLSAAADVTVQLDLPGGIPAEETIALLPSDTVRLEVGEATGAPGHTVDVGVALRTLGYAVTELRHELRFDGFAAIAPDGSGPDCTAGPFLTVDSAEFAFLPRAARRTSTASASPSSSQRAIRSPTVPSPTAATSSATTRFPTRAASMLSPAQAEKRGQPAELPSTSSASTVE